MRSTIASCLGVAALCGVAAAQTWSHDPESHLGPEHWGSLDPAFRTCGSVLGGHPGFQETGRRQSPIDLDAAQPARLRPLVFHYGETPFEIENNGHTVEVPYEEGSTLRVGDQLYRLRQFHFHAPSEHTVGGRSFPMELHLVHTDELGSNAVVAVLLEAGPGANELVEEIFAHAPADEGSVHLDGDLDASALLPRSLGYTTYAGSLTTPPCTEGVRWFVLRRTQRVSPQTVELFRSLISQFHDYEGYDANNRPVRPRNDRVVLRRR